LLYDLDQTERMLNLRIKVDVWSQGLEESARQKIRDNVRELYSEFPPQRVYYYVKRIRHMELSRYFSSRGPRVLQGEDYLFDGPEDVIAKGEPIKSIMCLVSQSPAAQVFRRDRLSTLLYFTASNAIKMAMNPDFSVDEEITMSKRGAWALQLMRTVVFGPQGE
jgi:hypothetical protein